jgi:hypothetical protein
VAETTQHDTMHVHVGQPRSPSSSSSNMQHALHVVGRKASSSRNSTPKKSAQYKLQRHHTTQHDISASAESAVPRPAAAPRPSLSTDESFQAQRFDKVISADHIDMDDLREVCWNGIPHQHRSQAWQHLLGYLPLNAERRAATLSRKRDEYRSYVEQHWESSGDYSARTIEERKMVHQVQVDCPRTEPNLPFFKTEAVQRSLERLLLTWSYRNPATSYVQGMNDLVAILFLVFLKPHGSDCGRDVLSDDNLFMVEADVYWCFTSLISQIHDHYVLDQPGVQRMVAMIEIVLQKVDDGLLQHFKTQGVPIFHFTFKWINCALTRELPLSSSTRLWDSLLSEGDDGFELLLTYVSVALLHSLRETLLEMSHDELLQFLTQEELQMSKNEIEEILSQAYIWKMTVSTVAIAVDESESKGVEMEEYGIATQESISKESANTRGNVLDNDEDILQAMMTSDYFLL